jgi:S1-C subfamily serine protease
MIALLVASAVAAATPVIPAVAQPSPYFLDDSTLVQVVCKKWTGTAFYVGNGIFVTARHVVQGPDKKAAKCAVAGGKPITVLSVGVKHDYAVFKADYYPPYRAILSCKPFQEGQNYYAQGYAEGRPWVVTQRLTGTRDHYVDPRDAMFSGGSIMRGAVTEGQSGGPVSDDDGLIVGIISAGSVTGETQQLFVALADTPFCKDQK